VKLIKISNKNRFGTTLFFIHTNISTMQPVEMYAIKKRSNDNEKNSRVGYFTFYNKNWLHYKVKVIFFFTSLINMYWLNVSIRLFFSYKNKTSPGSGEGEASSMFRWGRGGVVLCHILIEIASQWTIVGKVFGCVMRSGG
jgi:hypothetical protein